MCSRVPNVKYDIGCKIITISVRVVGRDVYNFNVDNKVWTTRQIADNMRCICYLRHSHAELRSFCRKWQRS